MRHPYHPPADPSDAKAQADVPQVENVDAFFVCKHGVDLCERRCQACHDEYMEIRAERELQEYRDGLR